MFYVMRKSKKKGARWSKTQFGRSGIKMTDKCESFRGIPLKCEADAALEEARRKWPDSTYRLIYSEEEL